MSNLKSVAIVVVVLIVGGLWFVNNEVLNPKQANVEKVSVQSRIKEFDVVARQFEFEPIVIEVNQGDLVRLNVISEDVPHGLAISSQEYDINVQVASGSTETVEFVASENGEFTFVCSVMCGEGHFNMRGLLIVH